MARPPSPITRERSLPLLAIAAPRRQCVARGRDKWTYRSAARVQPTRGSDVVLLDVAPPETLPLYRAGLGSVRSLAIVLLHAEADVLVARDLARARPTELEPSFWHGRIRTPTRSASGTCRVL